VRRYDVCQCIFLLHGFVSNKNASKTPMYANHTFIHQERKTYPIRSYPTYLTQINPL
jgi:hypothetical protein